MTQKGSGKEFTEDELVVKSPCEKCGIPMIVLLVVGVILVAVGGAMFPVLDYVIREQVKENVIISNTSDNYEVWQDVPLPVYMQFYMFNITNPEDVMKGKTPHLNEVGPFTYREYRTKYNIVWNHDNGTVTYRQNRTFYFEPEMSVAGEDLKITTINPLVATVAQNLHLLDSLRRKAIALALRTAGEEIILTRPVKELLWGFTDGVLQNLHRISSKQYPTVKIGYFIRKNHTNDGLYTVNTGEKDIDKLGYVEEFNGKKALDLWTTPWANMLNGSDGTVGPPLHFDSEKIPVFISDMCRSINGVYKGQGETPQGIKTRRFGAAEIDMANATTNPDNIGFCTPQTNCLPSGLLNSSLCQEPVNHLMLPVVFSNPHFLHVDPEVQKSIEGLNPVEGEHATMLGQEPWTGMVLQVAKKLQINMYVRKLDNLRVTRDIQTLYFPILWLNESCVVDDHWANKLKDQLFTPMKLGYFAKIGLIVAGGICILVAIVVLLWRRRAAAKTRFEKSNEPRVGASAKDAAYDKPVEEDDGRASVISTLSQAEGGRASVDTLEGKWYDPAVYGSDEDGNETPYGSLRSQETRPLIV